jgi:hypothetical protein
VNPTVSSTPIEECPPSTLAPAAAKTSCAAPITSPSHAPCSRASMRGRMTVATADCGAAPIAQTSPSAWTAATRATSAGSSAKALR